jgi:hypothetical protein
VKTKKIKMEPWHSELQSDEYEMSTEGQTDCVSVLVLSRFAGEWVVIRGQHSQGGAEYDRRIWESVPNDPKTVIVVIPGSSHSDDYDGDFDRVKEAATKLSKATFLRAPSCNSWSINRKGQLYIKGRGYRVTPNNPGVFSIIGLSSAGPSSAGSSSSGGSGKRHKHH